MVISDAPSGPFRVQRKPSVGIAMIRRVNASQFLAIVPISFPVTIFEFPACLLNCVCKVERIVSYMIPMNEMP
jgi:hypothetical protein